MKALVYTGPKALDYRDVAEPSRRPGDVLVRVAAVGICGSDMHAFLGHDERRPAPLILGHEAAGTIIDGPDAGSRVTVNPLVACHTCVACREGRPNLCPIRQIISMPPCEGAFADTVAMTPDNLVRIPDSVSFEKASLAEPIACGWHAVRLGARVAHRPLEALDCMVIGGGAIGVGAALCLLAHGASAVRLSEPNAKRHRMIASAGNITVGDPDADGFSEDSSADLVIDAVGFSTTRAAASRIVRPGGVIVHIGLGEATGGLDIRRMTLQEISFVGSYTYTPNDFRETAAAIFDGRLGALDWIEARPLSDGLGAFDDILAGNAVAPKIVLNP